MGHPLRHALVPGRLAAVPAHRPRHLLLAVGEDGDRRPAAHGVRGQRPGRLSKRERSGVAPPADPGRTPSAGGRPARLSPSAARRRPRGVQPVRPADGPRGGGRDRAHTRRPVAHLYEAARLRGPDAGHADLAVGCRLRAYRAADRDLARAGGGALHPDRKDDAGGHRIRARRVEPELGGAAVDSSRPGRAASRPCQNHSPVRRDGRDRPGGAAAFCRR